MADELMLEIVTPEKMAFSDVVEEVTIPGSEGEFGVLRGHAALLSSVDTGELNFNKDGKKNLLCGQHRLCRSNRQQGDRSCGSGRAIGYD